MSTVLRFLSGQRSSFPLVSASLRSCRGFAVVLGSCFALAAWSGTALGANGTWTATSGDWTTAGNWSPGVPGSADTAFFSNAPANAPVSVTVNGPQSINIFNFSNTGGRTYTFSGSDITFLTKASETDARMLTGVAAPSAITFNNNIVIGSGFNGPDAPARFTIGGTAESTSNFSTITFNGSIMAGSGTGMKTLGINSSATASIVINGSNTAGFLAFGGAGELVAGSTSALGAGSVQKTTSSLLSLRSNVTVGGSGYSWTTSSFTTSVRISELSASSADRTLTFNNRTIGTGGSIQWVDNVNSTGRLILELKYTGGTVQTTNFITNSSGVVRFAQSGNATYGDVISGAGQLEKAVGTGTTTLTQANTYTGKTTIAAGTLLLAAGGSIANSSEINLGTAGSQGTLNVAAKASFAFGAAQTVSGFGTINIGTGKTVSLAGNLNPGNSPGQITVTGNLALENTTASTMELAGLGGVKGTDFDNVTITENLTYDGALAIVSFGGFNIYQEGTYSLFDFAGWSGNFDTVSFGGNGLNFESGVWSGISSGYESKFTLATGDLVVTAVPEPRTVGLAALAAVSFLVLRRRTRNG